MKHEVFHTSPLKQEALKRLNYSQEKVSGFSILAYQKAKIAFIGAGAIGSHAAQGTTRKGAALEALFDDDDAEAQNLSRQLYDAKDIGQNKAISLGKRLSREGFFPTTIEAYPYRFQEALEAGHDFTRYDLLIGGVDNNPTRVAMSRYGTEHGIPVVHAGVAQEATELWCAVQEPGQACFGCMLPKYVNDDSYPCNLPGIIDVIQVVAGLIVFAVDSLICGRHREWNYRFISMEAGDISMDMGVPDSSKYIPRNPSCALCGDTDENVDTLSIAQSLGEAD